MEITDADCENELVARLHRKTPYMIHRVSRSQFSTARHYGGAVFSGDSYLYQPGSDTMVRADVVKALRSFAGERK